MPDQPPEKRHHFRFTLSRAWEQGRYVRACCGHCNVRRIYDARDMIQVAGDVDADTLAGRFRCEKCRGRGWMQVEFWAPTAGELVGLTVRRLVEIRMVRRIRWRDERLP